MTDPRPEAVGLCSRCLHAERVPGRSSVFFLCGLSRADLRYPKYPRLPVLACNGFEEAFAEPPDQK